MRHRLPSHDDILRVAAPARDKWSPPPPKGVTPIPPGPGQESVWDYPRPPEVRPASPGAARIVHRGVVVAETERAFVIVETAGAPALYFPPEDVRRDLLVETDHVTVCEWKGAAVHFDLVIEGQRTAHAAYTYPDPLRDLGQGYEAIAGWPSFYPARVDDAWWGGERARPQPGGLYAGWVTDRIVGPVKGGPGTGHW